MDKISKEIADNLISMSINGLIYLKMAIDQVIIVKLNELEAKGKLPKEFYEND